MIELGENERLIEDIVLVALLVEPKLGRRHANLENLLRQIKREAGGRIETRQVVRALTTVLQVRYS